MTGSTSDKESARSEERPKHRRKHSKKDRRGRRRSSSSSSSGSLSADELFHVPGGVNGLACKLLKVARRHPCKLLGKTLEALNTTLTPGAGPLGERKPAIMFQYLQKALAARRSDPRAERELTTVASAADNIFQGNLEEALDILARRFKRVEAEDSGALHQDLAERLEVIPDTRITNLSLDEQEEVVLMARKWKIYRDGRAKSPRRYGFGQEEERVTPPTPGSRVTFGDDAQGGAYPASRPGEERRMLYSALVKCRSPSTMREQKVERPAALHYSAAFPPKPMKPRSSR